MPEGIMMEERPRLDCLKRFKGIIIFPKVYTNSIYFFRRGLMSQFAKLFQNGSSQAVRLPREFRFKGDKVRIRRVGKSIVLEPLMDDPDAWLTELKNIPADPDFMKKRRQPKTPKRVIFK